MPVLHTLKNQAILDPVYTVLFKNCTKFVLFSNRVKTILDGREKLAWFQSASVKERANRDHFVTVHNLSAGLLREFGDPGAKAENKAPASKASRKILRPCPLNQLKFVHSLKMFYCLWS